MLPDRAARPTETLVDPLFADIRVNRGLAGVGHQGRGSFMPKLDGDPRPAQHAAAYSGDLNQPLRGGTAIHLNPGERRSHGLRWLNRTRLPDGSRNAQSLTPSGWSIGSCTTSPPPVWTCSKVASRSSVLKMTA